MIAQRLGRIRAFVFDFYGTLIVDHVSVPPMWEDLNDLGYRSNAALQAAFEPDAFDGCVTPTLTTEPSHDEWIRENWRCFCVISGVPDELIESTLTVLLLRQARFRAKSAPSAVSLVLLLRGLGLKIGVCSNWESPIEPYFQQAQLPPFDAVTISAEVGARKPHRAMFKDIAAKLGVDPSEAVFVGDNWSADIIGALRAGFFPVWIRGQRPPSVLPDHVADFQTLAELETAIRVATGAHEHDFREGDGHHCNARPPRVA